MEDRVFAKMERLTLLNAPITLKKIETRNLFPLIAFSISIKRHAILSGVERPRLNPN